MLIQQLRNSFISVKNYEPIDNNDLLDFARQQYLNGAITIIEYRNVIRFLECEGASKPHHVFEDYIEQ
ncbi:YppF family protein [Bacillus sp. PS06]|uniref:YppF family protein n=1 Tax=Bacillus sp. PS06 TaxID=2764176 RepID=UPI00177EC5D0|nr:YppF family protein [Bacillus sp. PS06]MBD8070204.1 hypothetical protein [Bacillus sp. PS06]